MAKELCVQSPLNKTFQDKYYFIFNLPDALKNLSNRYNELNKQAGISKDSIKFSIISADIPEVTVKAQDLKYASHTYPISSHVRDPYAPLTIEFKIDNQYANYSTLYEWLNFILNEKEGYFDAEGLSPNKKYSKAYNTTISVVSMDEYNEPLVQWIFTNAFISNLSGIQLNYQNSEEMVCKAQFVFSQLYMINKIVDGIKNITPLVK